MYQTPPSEDITLDDFERLALGRIRVLKMIEDMKLRSKGDKEILAALKEEVDRQGKLCVMHADPAWASQGLTTTHDEALNNDIVSHYILRLAYCRTAELRKWLLTTESDWFKLRFGELLPSQQVHFTKVVEVHFTKVPDLGLADVSRSWRGMFPDSDERLRPLVASLSSRYLGTDYSSGASSSSCEVTARSLPELAARHFPLCMTGLMTHLSADRHLRHGGRQQLNLFLKGVGLPLEEALIFWLTQFSPRYSSEAFDKEFAYNIRHSYGKEGKRTEYSAHNCVSIIRMSGGGADHHGCPYKRAEEGTLRSLLLKAKCSDKLTAEALQKAKGGHYQLACACAFEGVHGVATDIGISHPLQYFQESQRLVQASASKSSQEGGAVATAAPSQPQNPIEPVDDAMES
ncbi:MAG: hypothetical protein WDW38_001929 [Sanguina aurantia]